MIGSRPILAHPRSTPVSRTLALRLTCSNTRASRSESTVLAFLSRRKKLLSFEPVDSCAGTLTMVSVGLAMVVVSVEEEEEEGVRGVYW